MGMSAGQARLLSITTRLTNNEFRSQMITNSKLRLADKSSLASAEYMDALNSQKLVFGMYNDNGDYTDQSLTANFVYNYAPLKNQYTLENAAGKMLVSGTDAKNFEASDNLYEFLDKYGLLEDYTYTKSEVIENPEWTKWQVDYQEWEQNKPKKEDYSTVISEEQVTTRKNTSPIYSELTGKLYGCFGSTGAVSGNNCYMHVLAALIGVGEHTTTSGEKYQINYTSDHCSEHDEVWCWNTYDRSEEIGDELRQSLYTDKLSNEAFAGIIQTHYGDVYCEGSGEDGSKYDNVYQKCVDLLWEVHNEYEIGNNRGGIAYASSSAKFFYLIEFDLGESYTEVTTVKDEVFNEDEYNKATAKWQEEEPSEPEKNITVENKFGEVTINDKDKGQWYTNLWYAMNGSETANKVKTKESEGSSKTVHTVENNIKTGSGNYKVLEDNLASSPEWLQFALEQGIVTLKQAQFANPSVNSGKVPGLTSEAITWKSIIYTSAPDIKAKDDDVAIAIAEAKYTKSIKEIENQDQKYDQDLKKLDTEHSALQSEYESVKSVVSKNVERSFKAFS